ncbi:MAG TPA: hypothetical protein VGE52_08450 [Pirellulales bacterium]
MSQLYLAFGLAVLIVTGPVAWAGDAEFQPGDVIEYKVGVSVPVKWERGVIIKPLDGGKQYLIHEKPSQFFPEGPERAYSPEELRRLGPDAPPPPRTPGRNPNPPQPDDDASNVANADDAEGLLSEEDVLAFCRKVFGGADRETNEGNPMRTMFSDLVREHIKQHGTNFKASATGKFYEKLHAQGTGSVHIVQAINDNYGKHPELTDYVGTFLLRASNRGSNSVKPDGAGVKKILIQDSQAESGRLTINADGTYEWELMRGDPPAKWLRGKWREAQPAEMMPTEGGPAIWLEEAKGGDEYMVRMDREVGYADWINVGYGKGRTPVEYGRRATPK